MRCKKRGILQFSPGFSFPNGAHLFPGGTLYFPNRAHNAYFVSWALAKWPGSGRVGAEKASIDNIIYNFKASFKTFHSAGVTPSVNAVAN